jgi:arylsulfatase A-like enzyme/Tfp pilus assembly protein PilF
LSRPFRYTFIVGLVALATALAAVGGWRYARASAPVNGPIVLISIESLRADHLPAYGYRQVKTPAIDQLAADGIVFEHAYSHIPQTLPAHATLMTGTLPFENGVRDDVGFAIPEKERLLAEILRDRGYETGAVVSNVALRKDTGIGQGFAFFNDDLPPEDADTEWRAIRRDSADAERVAEQWLGRNNTPRRFLFVHLDARRDPDAAAKFAQYSPYDAEIAHADESVGRLLKYLKAHQLYDRTTIILVSDHGAGLGDHGEQAHGLFVYEEAVRVPLIIKQAAGEGAGRRVGDVVQHIDLMPTILDFAKAPVPGNLKGRSLKPLLDGTATFGRRLVYSESGFGRYHFGWAALQSVSNGEFRYILAPSEELYDLRTDLAQRRAIDDPKELAKWRSRLKDLVRDSDASQPIAISEPLREQLAELGAVGNRPSAEEDPEHPADPKDKYRIVEGYRAAIAFAANGEWARAIDTLRDVVTNEGDVADIWTRIATYAALLGHDSEAAAAFERVIAMAPQDAAAQFGAGRAWLRLSRFDRARKHAEKLVEADQPPAVQLEAHMLLAEIALARRDAIAARRQAALVAAGDAHTTFPAYVEGRIAYAKGRYAEALKALEAVSEPAPAFAADVHLYLGDTLAALGRFAEALPAFERAIAAQPLQTRARLSIARAYERSGQHEEAIAALTSMTRVLPTPDVFRLAADTAERFGEREEAAALRGEARRRFAEPARVATQ